MNGGFGGQNFGNLGQPFNQGMSALGSPFTNIPKQPQNSGQNASNQTQNGDVPPFDLPPPPQMPFAGGFNGQQMDHQGMDGQGFGGGDGSNPQMSQDDFIRAMYHAHLGYGPDQTNSFGYDQGYHPDIQNAMRLANQALPSYVGQLDGFDRMRGHNDGGAVNPDRGDPSQFDSARRSMMDPDSAEAEDQMKIMRGLPLY